MSLAAMFDNRIAERAHAQAVFSAPTTITQDRVHDALRKSWEGVSVHGIYRNTPRRSALRRLIDATHELPDLVMVVTTSTNKDGSLRTFKCRPLGPNSDETARYVTVWDVEAKGYRRVNLDGVLKLSVVSA